MHRALADFAHLLVASGMPIGTDTLLDAAQACKWCELGDLSAVRQTLRAILTKSVGDQEIFDRVFDSHFGAAPTAAEFSEFAESADSTAAPPDTQKPLPVVFGSAPISVFPLGIGGIQGATALADIAVAATGSSIRALSAQTQIGLAQHRLLQSHIRSDPDANAKSLSPDQVGRAEIEAMTRRAIDLSARASLRLSTSRRERRMLGNAEIARIARSEEADLVSLCRTLARLLPRRTSRRPLPRRQTPIDMARTIRASLRTGGEILRILRQPEREKTRTLLVLCDVSGSMRRHTLLFLMLLHRFVEDFDAHAFTFSSTLRRIDGFSGDLDFDDIYQSVSEEMKGATNYEMALQGFLQETERHLSNRTTILMFGDGRTSGNPDGLPYLRELGQRCGRLFWFNPEPEAAWGGGDSAARRYQSVCTTMFACSTLQSILDSLQAL